MYFWKEFNFIHKMPSFLCVLAVYQSASAVEHSVLRTQFACMTACKASNTVHVQKVSLVMVLKCANPFHRLATFVAIVT